MKKIFFTGLVAIVAIGGAFASKPSTTLLPNPVYDKNTCQEVEGCTSLYIGTPVCTILPDPADYVEVDCMTPESFFERF
ncbi:hypothetical protein FBD94_09880 [Pedobacter hiemivivus]|uniref:Uncharacterized protein n=1 Tax=Pedobacter hiemivivus TaxID=2530454 RepID=A0A4U1GHY0_9SPHI|nr:hypothetical protein [Pedobacter hiemivivus]TKC62513.1 hypothetical protein FBD94_09880 [Pedobacter hiemivivus]